jgi:hypothetical protein
MEKEKEKIKIQVLTTTPRRTCSTSSDLLSRPTDFSTLSAQCNGVQFTTEPQLPSSFPSSSLLRRPHNFPRRHPLLRQLHQASHTHTLPHHPTTLRHLSRKTCPRHARGTQPAKAHAKLQTVYRSHTPEAAGMILVAEKLR